MWQDNSSNMDKFKSSAEFSMESNTTTMLSNTAEQSPLTNLDLGHYLGSFNRQLYPEGCIKICSVCGATLTSTFDERKYALQGNCNYTFVQTTCLCYGSTTSVPLKIYLARAYFYYCLLLLLSTTKALIYPWSKRTK